MNTAAHLEKIARLEALRARLHPLDDFTLWFWTAMNAGTHAVNVALHEAGITRSDDVFPTQPGVYLVASAGKGHKPAFHPLGDILHVGRPKIDAQIPSDVGEMMALMEIIEEHRDPCVRGDREPTQAVVDECGAALSRCLEILKARLPA
jgi:hypothetical protein